MKTRYVLSTILGAALLTSATSCSDMLEEYNPGGGTMEQYAETDNYKAFVDQCYFAMCRYFYGTADATMDSKTAQAASAGFMGLTEGQTDLWTSAWDSPKQNPNYLWFMAGAPNTTYTNGFWNCAYDGIGSCNAAIHYAEFNKSLSKEQLNSYIAEARMMRAVYYFNIVEMFGGVVKLTTTGGENITYSPERVDPLTIYNDVIIPDLEFAAENMLVGTDATTTAPTRKAAIGFLAKAYLQKSRWDSDKNACYQKALENAKKLIADCESGGAQYNTYMYPNLADVFAEENNWNNREALWKQRWVIEGTAQSGSTGAYCLNRNHELFGAWVTKFGARMFDYHTVMEDNGKEGTFMPTQHLLNLYVQADGTLDPRFHQWFRTEWQCNREKYAWTASDCQTFGKAASMEGKEIKNGDLAIKFVMPQDADYAEETANAATSNYLLVDYKKLYSDAKHEIIDFNADGTENYLRYFWPALTKHNSTNFFLSNASKNRVGNLNATFIMRTPEVYLIAAEAAVQLGDAATATTYVNKIRMRAGAAPLSTVTLRGVLDERGRELCGEYNRFFDLARLGLYNDASYLQETHPNLVQYFKPEYALKPIPQGYIDLLENGQDFVNPGY